jgi:metal-responsive CopG/Arc/MetJ family transcriptional regulator
MNSTINLTLDDNLLEQIDAVARDESRTRSDLIYNSVKMYISRKQRLQELFVYGEHAASANSFTEEDILDEIKSYRKNK